MRRGNMNNEITIACDTIREDTTNNNTKWHDSFRQYTTISNTARGPRSGGLIWTKIQDEITYPRHQRQLYHPPPRLRRVPNLVCSAATDIGQRRPLGVRCDGWRSSLKKKQHFRLREYWSPYLSEFLSSLFNTSARSYRPTVRQEKFPVATLYPN